MIRRVALLAAALALGMTSLASAAPISFTLSGFGSGTLDGVAFGAAAPVAFTITAQEDTDTRTDWVNGGGTLFAYYIDNHTASIEIEGLGTFDFTSPTRFFVNVQNGITGFTRGSNPLGDIVWGPTALGWDMLSSLGPLTGDGFVYGGPGVFTDGGELVLNRGASEATFTAVVGGDPVPEPASLLLLGTGVALAVRRRVRRA